MKKVLSLLFVLVACFTLFACKETKPVDPTTPVVPSKPAEPTTPTPTTPTPTVPVDPTTPVPTLPTVPTLPVIPPIKDNATVIQFCTWGFGTEEEYNLLRRQIAKFNYDNDDIQIEIVVPDGDYNTFLETKASSRELPDVFMVNSVPEAAGRLAADITEIASKDAEWATVNQALKDAVTYNGKTFGIPAGQYYLGLFANYTLIEDIMPFTETQYASEMFAPGAFTTEQFIQYVKRAKNIKTDGTSTIGINGTGDMINWLPSTLDSTGKTGHFVWNAEAKRFDFDSPIMINALNKINELGDKQAQWTFEAVDAADPDKLAFGPVGASDVFQNGQMAFLQSATWSTFQTTDDCDYKFVGYPDGRVISASDYYCISRATKNMDAAWKVAKYLSFGVEGTKAKFDIVDANPDVKNLSITGMPLVNNTEIANKWFEYVKLNGAQEVYEKVQSGEMTLIVEGNKTVPGFQNARFLALTGLSYPDVRGGTVLTVGDYIWDVCGGDITVSQYQTGFTKALVDSLNKNVTDGYARIEDLTNDN